MDEQRVEIDIPKPQFTLLQVTRSGKPEILVLNAALVAFAHPPIFPWHLLVTLEAEELVANGMPSRPESEVLWRIGDEIEALVGSGKNAPRVGQCRFPRAQHLGRMPRAAVSSARS